jgi:D-3-phosphoglycerate dehydrogenase
MPTLLLTHTPDMLANYYGPRALAALRALCDVRLNETGRVLDDAAALAAAAKGCQIIVSDRQTPGPAEFFAQAPCASPSTSATSTCRRRASAAFW